MNFVRKYSMMMLLLTGAMTIASCSSDTDEFEANENNGAITFVAGMPSLSSETRTIINDQDQPLWEKHEKLRLFGSVSTHNAYILEGTNGRKTDNASFIMRGSDQNDFTKNKNNFDYVVAFYGPQEAYKNDKGIHFRQSTGSTDKLHTQTLRYKQISNMDDILVSQKVDPMGISVSEHNKLRMKRLNGFMRIRLVDNTTGHLLNNFVANDGGSYKIKTGWLTTGSGVPSDIHQIPTSGLYVENNFGGEADVNLVDGCYTLEKDSKRGSGIQLVSDTKGFFYDFADNDPYFIVSVLPTKLEAGDSFAIGLGNGENRMYIRKIVEIENQFEIKGCHIHDITINVNDDDIVQVRH